MNLTAACVLIAWYSQEKWVCLLTSTWYLLSPSLMSVYLLTCLFCRWFGYNLLAATQSFPVQPVLQQLSHMAGVFSSWILVLVDSPRSEVTGLCLCYMIAQLCCFKAKLLAGKRRPSQACPVRPSLPGNTSLWWKGAGTWFFTKSWNNEKASESLSIGYLLKVLFLSWDYPKKLVLLHIPFEEMWGWRLLIMLTSCYRECFRLKTDNLMYFGILEKYF